MDKLVKINNRLDKLIDRQETLFQTIKLEVVEPPSLPYKSPQVNPLTYLVKMHNNMAQSTPIDDGISEESYEDESENLNDTESLGANINMQEEESPIDSHTTFVSDPREDIMEESIFEIDFCDTHKPSPLSADEVASPTHISPIPTFNHLSHPKLELVYPIF